MTFAYLEPFSIGNDAISSSLSLGHAWLHTLRAKMMLVLEAKMIRDVFLWCGRTMVLLVRHQKIPASFRLKELTYLPALSRYL